MPGGTASGDDDAFGILKLVHVLPQSAQYQTAWLGIQSTSQAISNRLGLLENFFEHEMLVASLFNRLQLHLQLVDVGVGGHVFNGFDLKLSIAYHGDFVIVQVDHLVGVLNDRRSIGSKEIFPFTYSNDQGRPFSRRNKRVRFLQVDQHNRIGPYHLV